MGVISGFLQILTGRAIALSSRDLIIEVLLYVSEFLLFSFHLDPLRYGFRNTYIFNGFDFLIEFSDSVFNRCNTFT